MELGRWDEAMICSRSSSISSSAGWDAQPAVNGFPDRVTLWPGEERRLRLPSLAGAGYRWEVTVEDAEIAEVAAGFEDAAIRLPGRAAFGAFELLTVRGRRVGRTRVCCRQRRSWESGSAAVAEHMLRIDVVAVVHDQPSEEAAKR